MKLLVRATNWLGDAVMSIPALREIRRAYAGWEIVILARPWVADLYGREDFCDRILPYENNGRHAGWRGKLRLGSELRAGGFDTAILLQNAFDAALVTRLAGIPNRIGYARDGRGLLLTKAVAPPRKDETPVHQRYYYLELLRRAGVIPALPVCDEIRLGAAPQAAAEGREYWQRQGVHASRWIGVSPGAAYGSAKRWFPERFAETASQLADRLDAHVAVFGSAGEAELCGSVARSIGARAHDVAGRTTLAEFIKLAAACTVFLTNDSGAMHVAAALGIPTVAVFGATEDVTTGPSAGWARVVRRHVECSPCLLRECPIDHRCMTAVEVSRVVEEACALLRGNGVEVPGPVIS
jgi:heptosyltransferase-2